MISLAHRLTEIAIILQDNQTIQEVRSMLKSLDLTAPAKSHVPSIQGSPQELKKRLKEGIEIMRQTNQDIQKLDRQRSELKKAVRHYGGELADNPFDSTTFSGLETSKKSDAQHPAAANEPKAKGMAFLNKRR